MKTKNNVQKSLVRSLTLFGGLVLLSVTLAAQTLRNEDAANAENQAIAMVTKVETIHAKLPEMSSNTEMVATFETEQEAPLEIESWMINEKNFEMKPETQKETKARKVALIMENSNKKFGRRLFVIYEEEDETDQKLQIEPWMVDYRIWNRK